MTYDDWLKTVPTEITGDSLWGMTVYRHTLFLGELTWIDLRKLNADKRTYHLSNQLYRAIGSIGANIAEGYSYSSKKEQARYYQYALGSAREARHWYFQSKHLLGEEVTPHRLQFVTQIIRQLLKIIPAIRFHRLSEEPTQYNINDINDLLNDIPIPED